MRKEIKFIILFFFIIFTLISLTSYSPADPSLNVFYGTLTNIRINNLLGLVGAYFASFTFTVWGIGSFWIPFLFATPILYDIFKMKSENIYVRTVLFGLLLIITTSTLLGLNKSYINIAGTMFPATGIVGFFLKFFLIKYTKLLGAVLILIFLFCISLIAITGISFKKIFKFLYSLLLFVNLTLFDITIKKLKKRKLNIVKSSKNESENDSKNNDTKKNIEETNIKKIVQENWQEAKKSRGYELPNIELLDDIFKKDVNISNNKLNNLALKLEQKLEDFGIQGKVISVIPGPVITTFEYRPASGVKISKISNLSNDLALGLSAKSIRIIAPIPGRDVIGIEIPNDVREIVPFKEIVSSLAFQELESKLTICLGKDIEGKPVAVEMDKMPHLLIAGATGTGKSVGLNVMIASLLYKATPDEIKLIMIDPKRIELSIYNNIPHLITNVVTDTKEATNALIWAVQEMERRYELLANSQARNIQQYNESIEKSKNIIKKEGEEELKKLPYIVIIVDEFADLMMVASKDVEFALTRLAQMARAAGMHIILATQRPSVDVLTGIIKANFPTRISFQVSSKIDSRTIIDGNGAETLLGNGDMLFLPPGTARIKRIHGAYISDNDVKNLIKFLKSQGDPEYNGEVTKPKHSDSKDDSEIEYDEKYDEVLDYVVRTRKASISSVQREFRIGYNRAARIIETLEKEGVISQADGAKQREVLVNQ